MQVVARAMVVDESILDSYRILQDEGQPDVVTEFIDVFLADLPERIGRIRAAVAAGSAAALTSAAHSLKGSSGSVGAVSLAGLCAQLEANARTGSLDGAAELVSAIDPEITRVREELARYRRP